MRTAVLHQIPLLHIHHFSSRVGVIKRDFKKSPASLKLRYRPVLTKKLFRLIDQGILSWGILLRGILYQGDLLHGVFCHRGISP